MSETQQKKQLSVNFCFCCISCKSTTFFTFFLFLNLFFALFTIVNGGISLVQLHDARQNQMALTQDNGAPSELGQKLDRRLRILEEDKAQKITQESTESNTPKKKFEINVSDVFYCLMGEMDELEIEILEAGKFDQSIYHMIHIVLFFLFFFNNVIALISVCNGNYSSFSCMFFAYYCYFIQLLELIVLVIGIIFGIYLVIFIDSFITWSILIFMIVGFLFSLVYFYWSKLLLDCYKHHKKIESKEELIEA